MSNLHRRLLVISPGWRAWTEQDWTERRHWLLYTVVAQWWDEATDRWSQEYVIIGRAWTWDGADNIREHIRRFLEVEP